MSTNTPANAEIWHLSIDDLLAPLPETFRLGGPGPFVINLRSSSASMVLPAAGIVGEGEPGHVYQIQRFEEDTVRYRLRLGPFASEEDADARLGKVRDVYPCALTATAGPEDLRIIETLRQAAAKAPASAPVPAMHVDTAVLTPPPVAAEAAPLSLAPAPPPSPAPVSSLSLVLLQSHPAEPSAAAPRESARFAPPSPVVTPGVVTPGVATPRVATLRESLQQLESTQTVRQLTPLELDSVQLRWFVIQLSLSQSEVDPDAVPNLDIFTLYRLYSVSGLHDGRFMHALRLGFFAEEGSAGAVAQYLAAYYDSPIIKRVSVAERERFSDRIVAARKDVGATGEHTAIEITSERHVRYARKSTP